MKTLHSSLVPVVAALATVTLALTPTESSAQSPFTSGAPASGRALDATLPNEAVDPFSGSLSIVETDLVLPGNAGLDVRVQRVYNSAIYPGYQSGDLTIEEDSWAGIGWKLHFGRVINPSSTTSGATQIEMGDGSRHALYTTSVSPGWTTKSFWLYDRSTHTLKLPNGLIYEFGHVAALGGSLGTVRYVTVIRDPFGNRIEFSYFAAPGPPDGVSQIRQILSPGQVRAINFTYDTTGINGLSSMTYGSRTWIYIQQPAGPAGYSTLADVHPPVGPGSEYDYSTPSSGQPGHELTVLHTPGGGTVTYTYADVTQQAGAVTNVGRGVVAKALGGLHVTGGTWTYSYGTGANLDTTRVVCPCGTTSYRFNGIGTSGPFSGWLAGTLAERKTEHQSVVYEREVLTWQQSEAISPDPTVGSGGTWSDTAVFTPLLSTRTITRGTESWVTTHEYRAGLGNYNDYGRPWRTSEDGELDRTTTRTFQGGFTPYIVPQVVSEVVGPAGFERKYEFDLATGFLRRTTLHSFASTSPVYTYEIWPDGNIKASIDPIGNRTEFLYSWGRVRRVTTPHVITDYEIAPDGTVTWEETGGRRTVYSYDAAFRLTEVRPPGGESYRVFARASHERG